MSDMLSGDIICVKALGNTMVILNSLEAITGLLDKRSNRFSYRPRLVMAGEVMGLDRVRAVRYGFPASALLRSTTIYRPLP